MGCKPWGYKESDTTEQLISHILLFDGSEVKEFGSNIHILLLHGVSVAACSLFSSYGDQGLFSSWGAWDSHCDGFPCCRAWALGHVDFSSCGSWVLECWLRSCDPWA